MLTLVPDALILFRLEQVGLLELAFNCGLSMVVPDYMYQQELENESGTLLLKLGLKVVSLTSTEMITAQALKSQCGALSNADCQLLACGSRPDHALGVWNMNLEREAKANNVKVYNLLWILDQMDVHGQVKPELLCQALNKIKARNMLYSAPKWNSKSNREVGKKTLMDARLKSVESTIDFLGSRPSGQPKPSRLQMTAMAGSTHSKFSEADVPGYQSEHFFSETSRSAMADYAKSLIMESSRSEHAPRAAWQRPARISSFACVGQCGHRSRHSKLCRCYCSALVVCHGQNALPQCQRIDDHGGWRRKQRLTGSIILLPAVDTVKQAAKVRSY